MALCLVVFAPVTWQVRVDGPLLTPDEVLSRAMVGRLPALVTEFLADLGNLEVALVVLVLALAARWWVERRVTPLLYALLPVTCVPLLVAPLKAWTERPGPLDQGTGYYPSGHAATALVVYGVALLLLVPYVRWRRGSPLVLLAVVAVGNGIGLVSRGYHWPLDVLASWALGGVLLLAIDYLGLLDAAYPARSRRGDQGASPTLNTGGPGRRSSADEPAEDQQHQ
ncbi:phosphatase PAP2 family protein [Streptomyces sp. NPDC005438]|uniref:phosphatase PAP2 family protein n=1 Tax=Streptomyces sp. NPDC005438 TaxID=3156880 RepID=UPI0033B4EA2C